MRIATTIIITGLVLLFLGSLYLGYQVFSPYERSLDTQLSQAKHRSPKVAEAIGQKIEFRKVRLAFGSFDLVGGLTDQELESMSKLSQSALPYYFLIVSLWLVWGFRMSR